MSFVVYSAAALLAVSAVLLSPKPRAALRNPLTASTSANLALAACCFTCSAPVTLSAVNAATGVPNFGAPLTYSLITAYSCSLLVLLITWRGGSPARVRRLVCRVIAGCAFLITAIVVLFALADAPVERLRDLDTYYSTTPGMREMIALYLLGHGVCALIMCAVCLKWARTVTGLLRRGLWLILIGIVVDVVGFEFGKITAVVARWTGHDLDFLSTDVAPPMASLGALICSAGFVLPRLLPAAREQWRSLWDYRELAPLWAAVGELTTAPKPAPSWWQFPKAWLQWRELSIHDALLQLTPAFDKSVGRAAYTAARARGHTPEQARVVCEAAMVVTAARGAQDPGREPALDDPGGADRYRLRATAGPGTGDLVQLARALRRLPLTGEANKVTVRASQE
ncbi:DUF6545 domain-containing protein [Streptomyces sp. NPDC127079]|uniref:DUF6545 domain-containing protein n=1 Tax=Streptomyces sp. NPDC127079 TaxID=3347132 RepID=UPI0036693042